MTSVSPTSKRAQTAAAPLSWRDSLPGWRSHFEAIGNNGIQIQNANATDWVLEGVIVTGNVFRDVNVGVILSESWCGLKLQLPITGAAPDGIVVGGSSGAQGSTDPSQWQPIGAAGKAVGCLRVIPQAKSYPATFRVGERLEWAKGQGGGKGSGVVTEVHYDRVSRVIIANNFFTRSSAPNAPAPPTLASGAIAPPAPDAKYAVYCGDSAAQVSITGNVIHGMSVQAMQINSTGAFQGVSNVSAAGLLSPFSALQHSTCFSLVFEFLTGQAAQVSVANNVIDCCGTATGVWYRRLRGVSIQGNVVTRAADRSGKTPGIDGQDGVESALVLNNLCS